MLTSAQAASRLGVTETRIRALIAAGTLKADKFAGRWFIDDAALELLAVRKRPTGHRAMSPRVAWAVAALLDDLDASWVQGSQRSRLQSCIRQRVDPATWLARLARRAVETHEVRVHQQRAELLIADPRTRRSDPDCHSLVREVVVGGPEQVNVWIRQDDWTDLRAQYGLLDSSKPNLRVRVAPADVAHYWQGIREVPRLIAAADLWEEGGARSRAAAVELFESVRPILD